MKSAHGVIQGHDGVATVDGKHQVIVHAEAFGEAQKHDLLVPMVEGPRENFQAIGAEEKAKLAADAAANMQRLFEQGIDGYVADILFRQRDPRVAEAGRITLGRLTATRRGFSKREQMAWFLGREYRCNILLYRAPSTHL